MSRFILLALGLILLITLPVGAQEDGQGAVASGKLMLSPDDNPMLLYTEDTVMRLLVCHTPDCQEREIVMLGNVGGSVPVDATMILDAQGYPVIGYYYAEANSLGVIVCDSLDCHDPYLPIVDQYAEDMIFRFARHISLARTSSGNPVLSYYEDITANLKLTVCDDPVCASAHTITVAEGVLQDSTVGQRTSLVLDANDAPYIAHFSAVTNNLVLTHCESLQCATPTTIVIDDTPTATWASLALTPAGLSVIAYSDGFDLKLATCADTACSASTISVVSTNVLPVGDGGVPLLIGPNGAPIVVYAEGDPSSLMITICEDLACLDFTTITAVPEPGAGEYPLSATLNTQRHVVAFYRNPMLGEYHLMVCNDASCSAPTLTVFGEQIAE